MSPSRNLQRLFVPAELGASLPVALDKAQAHYVGNVLRLRSGDEILLFNGVDGEWRARVDGEGKRTGLVCLDMTRPQGRPGDVQYLFAPLKSARLDYMAQKATEMGASRLVPVLTHRTQVSRINLDRLRANAVEAAEQCGLLSIPEIAAEEKLPAALARLEPGRTLVFCDEAAEIADPLEALSSVKRGAPLAVLIGPEGGFDEAERRLLAARPGTVRLSLGPRIMRADTAAVAALALVQAVCGDWHAG